MSETIERPGWERAGVPHRGWTCVNVEDLDEQCFTCEMCKSALVRYLHTMEHPEYSGQLRVGCVCAENMSGDYVGPRLREGELRNAANRRKALLAHKREVAELTKAKRELKREIAAMGSVFKTIRDAATWIEGGEAMLAKPGLRENEREFIGGMVERFENNPWFEPTPRQVGWFVDLCKRFMPVAREDDGG